MQSEQVTKPFLPQLPHFCEMALMCPVCAATQYTTPTRGVHLVIPHKKISMCETRTPTSNKQILNKCQDKDDLISCSIQNCMENLSKLLLAFVTVLYDFPPTTYCQRLLLLSLMSRYDQFYPFFPTPWPFHLYSLTTKISLVYSSCSINIFISGCLQDISPLADHKQNIWRWILYSK